MVKHNPYRYRDFSRIAALAALAAGDQGRFPEMHRLLLERSPKLDRESLIGYAREIGLDVPRFTKDLDADRNGRRIDEDQELAERLDLYTTPAFFINGLKLLGDRPYEAFRAVVDRELARPGGNK